MPLKYIAIDPGETSGVAEFNEKGECTAMHQLRIDPLLDYLAGITEPPEVVIFEEYKIFGHKAKSHTNSKVPTLQVVGMIKAYARRWGSKVVEQPSQLKKNGYLLAKIKPAAQHKDSHQLDAFVHGFVYLVREGVVTPK